MKTVIKWLGGYFKKLDWILLAICAAITVFDIIIVNSLYLNGEIGIGLLQTQIFAAVAGFFAAIIVGMIDYRVMAKYWFIYAPVAVVLQLLVFTPLGMQRDDDLAWLDLGFISFQPSEILKIAYILTLAAHINKLGDKLNSLPRLALLCVHGFAPFLLVLYQGDAGTALVFLFIFLCMVFVAGISWKYIAAALVATPAVLYVAWNYVMADHHRMRFIILFDEQLQEAEKLDIYMQQYRAKVAMGSGQLTGLGFHSDSYTYVPEIYNDFIFSYIGMTLGFIGCMAVVIALAVLCLKLLSNASAAQDKLGKMICIGVFAMMIFHSIINIGMVLSVVPVIGITLPFLSTGGTSMIMMYVSLGPVLSISTHKEKKKHMFYEEKD